MKNTQEYTKQRFQRFQLNMIVCYIALLAAVVGIISFLTLNRSKQNMQDEGMKMMIANSQQLEININNYFEKVERNATLLYANDDYYLYDATDESIDDYDRIQYENAITDRIVDLGLMENYADFGIIYANNRTVGWISNATKAMYKDDGLYAGFSYYIPANRTKDAWVFGADGNQDRMYYLKQLNPNAFLIASFYSHELDNVFELPDELQNMTIRLINDENIILFSSNREENGTNLDNTIATIANQNVRVSGYTDTLLVNSNTCENGWRLVCTIPTADLMSEITSLQKFIFTVTVVILALSMAVALFMLKKLSKPMDGLVDTLSEQATIDQLSGTLNKNAFMEEVENRLKKSNENTTHTFCMFDADNFKKVNDTLGHAYGDDVIHRFGALLNRFFSSTVIVGRLGGDEFAIYKKTDKDIVSTTRRTLSRIDYIYSEYREEFEKEVESCDLGLSCGIRIVQGNIDFEDLYNQADQALYQSKNSGKNRYTVYQEKE